MEMTHLWRWQILNILERERCQLGHSCCLDDQLTLRLKEESKDSLRTTFSRVTTFTPTPYSRWQKTHKILSLHQDRYLVGNMSCCFFFALYTRQNESDYMENVINILTCSPLGTRWISAAVRMISFRWQANKSHTIWKWNEMAYINGLHYFLLNRWLLRVFFLFSWLTFL